MGQFSKSWFNSNRTKKKKIMFKIIRIIRIGFLHARYHRNIKKAEVARIQQNIIHSCNDKLPSTTFILNLSAATVHLIRPGRTIVSFRVIITSFAFIGFILYYNNHLINRYYFNFRLFILIYHRSSCMYTLSLIIIYEKAK